MTRKELIELIKRKKSFLCVGLDPDMQKLPRHLLKYDDPVFEFDKQIIDATLEYAVAYKPNLAFYECLGTKGMISLEKTIRYLNKFNEQIFTIADAKRGDIGNTSRMYAQSFFGNTDTALNYNAVTVAPYMGEDSVTPFLEYSKKWVILLALTSNKGAEDFQFFKKGKTHLFEQVLERSQQWGGPENMMYVVGATQAKMLAGIRKIVPHHFLLVPGVGAQGGSLKEVAAYGMNSEVSILVNMSRSIIFASGGEDFALIASAEAKAVQSEMELILNGKKII